MAQWPEPKLEQEQKETGETHIKSQDDGGLTLRSTINKPKYIKPKTLNQ